MSDAFDPGNEPDSTPPTGSEGPPPAGAPPGGPPGAPPGGGPILAMLGKQQPPVTAPGPGNMAQGMNLMTKAHGLLTQALSNFPAGSPQWKDCHKSLGMIAKHMAQEAPSASTQQTVLLDMAQNAAKNALLQRIIQSKSQSPGGGEGPGSGQPGIPSPATPLPGA